MQIRYFHIHNLFYNKNVLIRINVYKYKKKIYYYGFQSMWYQSARHASMNHRAMARRPKIHHFCRPTMCHRSLVHGEMFGSTDNKQIVYIYVKNILEIQTSKLLLTLVLAYFRLYINCDECITI